MFIASAILAYAFAAFILLIALNALFGPWLAFTFKVFEASRKRQFFGLLARQSTKLNLWFGALFTVVVLAALLQGYFKLKAAVPAPELLQGALAAGVVLPPPLNLMIALCGSFGVYVFLLAIAHFTWQKLKARHGLQAFLLLLAAVAGCLALALAFHIAVSRPQILNSYYYISIFSWTASMYPFGTPTEASSALMIIKFVSGALGIAATMCACATLIFRKRDDFGRDYYNFAMRHLARWGLACTIITLASGLGMMLLLRNIIGVRFDLGVNDMILCSLIYASCGLFWFTIMRSLTPLRHKAGLWICLVALLIAMLGHLIFVRNFFVATGMMAGGLPF